MPVRPKRLAGKPSGAEQHQARENSNTRGYTYRWRKARAGWLRNHPLCAHCENEGRVRAATDVDHIVPHKGDMQLFWDSSNWQSLCAHHHGIKTATEDGGFGRVVTNGPSK